MFVLKVLNCTYNIMNTIDAISAAVELAFCAAITDNDDRYIAYEDGIDAIKAAVRNGEITDG